MFCNGEIGNTFQASFGKKTVFFAVHRLQLHLQGEASTVINFFSLEKGSVVKTRIEPSIQKFIMRLNMYSLTKIDLG